MAWRNPGDGEKVFRDNAKFAMLCCDADVSATNSYVDKKSNYR